MGRVKRSLWRRITALVLLVATSALGVYVIRGGIVEHGNAVALKDPDSDFVPVMGAVTDPPTSAGNSNGGSRQMSVQFVTADGRRVKTRVWTRRGNDEFEKGQRIDLEYVTERPNAARLPGNQGGEPELWMTLVFGVGILGAAVLLPLELLFKVVSGRRRRRGSRARKDETGLPPGHIAP
jgi:hypothetical protein